MLVIKSFDISTLSNLSEIAPEILDDFKNTEMEEEKYRDHNMNDTVLGAQFSEDA